MKNYKQAIKLLSSSKFEQAIELLKSAQYTDPQAAYTNWGPDPIVVDNKPTAQPEQKKYDHLYSKISEVKKCLNRVRYMNPDVAADKAALPGLFEQCKSKIEDLKSSPLDDTFEAKSIKKQIEQLAAELATQKNIKETRPDQNYTPPTQSKPSTELVGESWQVTKASYQEAIALLKNS